MCNTCGCNVTAGNRHLLDLPLSAEGALNQPIAILNSLLDGNDRQASLNRQRFDAGRVLAINLMSSPGSGKTALLEATIRHLAGRLRIGVIEGDLETENDADRIRALGVTAHQITTGTACHLDAHLVAGAFRHIDPAQFDILFIENVGNLVCPASFDLGHHRNVALLSVTEGDDKPAKYPVMFRAADLMVLSKADLLQYLPEFSPEKAEACLRRLASSAPVITLSGKTGEGMDRWIAWLQSELASYRALLDAGQSLVPRVDDEGRRLHAHAAGAADFTFRPGSAAR